MVFWSKILFQLGFLILTIELSTGEELNPLKYRDTAKIAHALSNVSRALECFGETTAASQRDQSAALHELGNRLQESLQLQRDSSTCSSSVEKLADTIEPLNQATKFLTFELEDKEKKVRYLLEKNADLEDHLNATLEKVAMMEHDIKAQKEQLLEKDEKVVLLEYEIDDQREQLLEKDAKIAAALTTAGYKHYPGFGFYKFFPRALNWPEAVESCRAGGTHLGIINSDEEANIYLGIISTSPSAEGADYNNYFLIGISAIPNTRTFQTLDGIPLSESGYSKWDYGEPNNVNYPEECGTIKNNVRFNDVPCTMRFAYICELEFP